MNERIEKMWFMAHVGKSSIQKDHEVTASNKHKN